MEEFKSICKNEASEMFLTIIILLQNSIPCTENYYRYKTNYMAQARSG